MNVQALLHAGVGGIADRGRQAFARSVDRLVVALQPDARRWPAPAHLAPDAASLGSLRVCDGRFFAGATDDITSFADRFPLEKDRTLFSAQARCDGRFDLLGYRALDFGAPIVWHYDPLAAKAAPLTHWSEIDALDYGVVGDSKVVWELNRHQWFCELGQAWRLSGDERYAEAFVDAVTEWMRANPPGVGINWASSLEASMRTVSWCWALRLFQDAPQLTPSLTTEMLAWIRTHALHVERFLSYYYSPNTHLTGEALGLFHAGTVFPKLPGAARWRRLGARILLTELDRQVNADGGHFELATCYHRYTTEMYLHFLILAQCNGMTLPKRVGVRTQSMLDYLLTLCRPDRTMPSIGDDDGGAWTRLAYRERGDVAGVFSTAAALFGRSDYAWMADGLQPETWWLLGEAGCARFDELKPAPPTESPSRLLRDSGYAVMRSAWSAQANQLVMDAGPLGCPVSAAHGHADALALQLTVAGTPLLVDPGTGRYVADGWRDYFRSTAAHSTVTIDQSSQAEPASLFAWRDRPATRIRAWASDSTHDFIDAEHDGYRRLSDPVTHRRRVLYAKPDLWVVVDDLSGDGSHTADLRFQFAPDTMLATDRDAGWCSATAGDVKLWMKSLSAANLTVRADEGWVSDAYGQREPSPALSVSSRGQLPLRVITVLVAGNAQSAPPHGCIRRRSAREDCIEVAGHTITIAGDTLSLKRSGD